MNDNLKKDDAARFLGVSVRTLENYVKKGLISSEYEQGKTRSVATFKKEHLENLQNQMKDAAQVKTVKPETSKARNTEIVKRSEFNPKDLLTMLAEAMKEQHAAPSLSDLAHKLTLSISEASQLSGLSQGHIREAIHNKKLKAKIIGKGWRIKSSDLQSYVAKL